MENSWDLPFFLMQCGADERLGNLASENTVYPFSFCDLFCVAGFVLASRSRPSLSATLSISFLFF